MKIPASASVDVQQSFREVYAALDPWIGAKPVDLRGRRLSNAGSAVASTDYATLGDVSRLVSEQLAVITGEISFDIAKLKGSTLPATVLYSSLTTVGTLTALNLSGGLVSTSTASFTPTADSTSFSVNPAHATYTGNAIYVNTARAANSAFNLLSLNANSVAQFHVGGSGWVGIGTNSPARRLHVVGSIRANNNTDLATGNGSYGGFFGASTTVTGGAGATAIKSAVSSEGSVCVVSGVYSSHAFTDVVHVSGRGTVAPVVINAIDAAGTPATRTYTMASEVLKLALSGTDAYSVRVTGMGGDET